MRVSGGGTGKAAGEPGWPPRSAGLCAPPRVSWLLPAIGIGRCCASALPSRKSGMGYLELAAGILTHWSLLADPDAPHRGNSGRSTGLGLVPGRARTRP
jgi:hypothetical protein